MVEIIVHDLRAVLRPAQERYAAPSAAICASRTRQAMPTSGTRVGDDGAKRRRGSQVHLAVDTSGHLLALHVPVANAPNRSRVRVVADKVHEVTGEVVDVAFMDQGDTGNQATQEAKTYRLYLEMVKLPEAQKGFVLLPRRWIMERSNT